MSPTTRGGSRELDLVLLGATGFVGRLTARHLLDQAPEGTRIALAGRSAERLAALAADLGGRAADWPLLVVDATEPAAVAGLAARTRVVASTVGPYLRYGLPLVQACAEAGTDYVDLTGETLFVRRSLDAADEAARASGARIVHSCGFDSVPSDLGVGLAAARAEADGAGTLTTTVLHVRSMRGGVSGGTIDSLRQQLIETGGDPALRRLTADPYAFVDGGRPPTPSAPTRRRRPVGRDVRTGRWHAPFVMGGYNRQVVLRSRALTDGSDAAFRYREVIDTGTGVPGLAAAVVVAAGFTALLGGMWFGPTRALLDRVLPEPGEGPSEKTRSAGRFRVEVVAETTSGARYTTEVGADLDPGYGGTAVMLGQSALCLLDDPDLPVTGGVLTPMTAMGEALATRLRAQGFVLSTRCEG